MKFFSSAAAASLLFHISLFIFFGMAKKFKGVGKGGGEIENSSKRLAGGGTSISNLSWIFRN